MSTAVRYVFNVRACRTACRRKRLAWRRIRTQNSTRVGTVCRSGANLLAPLPAGLALGYLRGSTGGSWIARHHSREWGRRDLAIGPADDTLDAGALSFDAAQAKAREWLATVPAEQDAPAGPLTVARACDDYLAFLRHDGRSDAAIRDATYRIEAFIRRRSAHARCNR